MVKHDLAGDATPQNFSFLKKKQRTRTLKVLKWGTNGFSNTGSDDTTLEYKFCKCQHHASSEKENAVESAGSFTTEVWLEEYFREFYALTSPLQIGRAA